GVPRQLRDRRGQGPIGVWPDAPDDHRRQGGPLDGDFPRREPRRHPRGPGTVSARDEGPCEARDQGGPSGLPDVVRDAVGGTGALITGNTVVFKPASDTPYMGLKLAALLHEAGLPPGVFNYVTGAGATVGQELVDNPEVDGFVFTGSRAVGLAAFKTFTQNRP